MEEDFLIHRFDYVGKLGGKRRGRREALVFVSEGVRNELDWDESESTHARAVCW